MTGAGGEHRDGGDDRERASGFVPRVWAPAAEEVQLDAEGHRRPMTPDGGGWWTAGEALPPGTAYGFVVEGDGPLPDPRSHRQPEGVHGPSRVVDHDAFRWTDRGWSGFHFPSAVLYELHPGTFTAGGTLDAAISRLDHLVELGVTAVQLMPVAAFSGRHGWGYDGVALHAVHEPYGGPDGLKRFVDACHARGLGVLLDVVYNHLGPSGNYLARFGPYFTGHYHTPWGDAVNFDRAGSDEVRRFVLDNAVHWLHHYHLDGLRLDAVHAILDMSAVHVLEALQERVERLSAELGRPLWLVAESDLNDPRLLRPREAGGYGLAAQWSDDFHHALHAALTGERIGYYRDFGRLADVARTLERAWLHEGGYSEYRRRSHGRPADGLRGWRFLGYLQNHDQVGNRARGDRIGHLVGPGLQKVGAALVLTSPFVPMLFQGEEWAASTPFQYFTDHQDPDLAASVREGRRREFSAFGWEPGEVPDPQAPETFRRSCLDWTERERAPHDEVLAWYRDLVRLRKETPALLDGRLDAVRTRVDEAARTLVVARGPVVVVCNLSDEERRVEAEGRVELASREGAGRDCGAVRLPPRSAVVLRREGADRRLPAVTRP